MVARKRSHHRRKLESLLMASKTTASKSEASYTDSLSETLKLIADGVYGGDLIDLRAQADRLQTRPAIAKKAAEVAAPMEAQRLEARKAAADKGEEPALKGLTIPFLPLAAKALVNDPEHGTAYTALAGVMGDAPLYWFRKDETGPIVRGYSYRVMAGEIDGEPAAVVVGADNAVLEDVEFIGTKLGNGGYALVKVGPVILKVGLAQSDAYRRERTDKKVDPASFDFDLKPGAPALTMPSAQLPGVMIDSLATAPMAFIHPREQDRIPWNVPLKIERILGARTRYEGVRLVVTDPDGSAFFGLLAVDPIRKLCGEQQKSEAGGRINVLTEASIGRRFQIDGAALRVNKKGLPINVEGETESEFRARARKDRDIDARFIEVWDVVVSDPDDDFELAL